MTNKSASRVLLIVTLATFFVSGACALMYQLCWQRMMFAVIGVDIDSITIIVAVFMLGLGIGGLLGGKISDSWPKHLLLIYGLTELLIALYGLNSQHLFSYLSGHSIFFTSASHLLNSIGCFLILLIPTVCMGLTLPVLTMALNNTNKNIGASIGLAYFTNTVGAALGSLLVSFVFFNFLTLNEVLSVAACGNFISAAFIIAANFLIKAAE